MHNHRPPRAASLTLGTVYPAPPPTPWTASEQQRQARWWPPEQLPVDPIDHGAIRSTVVRLAPPPNQDKGIKAAGLSCPPHLPAKNAVAMAAYSKTFRDDDVAWRRKAASKRGKCSSRRGKSNAVTAPHRWMRVVAGKHVSNEGVAAGRGGCCWSGWRPVSRAC